MRISIKLNLLLLLSIVFCLSAVFADVTTCQFLNSNSLQKCQGSSSTGKYFSCSGTSSCSINVTGRLNETFVWNSTCRGTGRTIIDGLADKISFTCTITTPCTDSDGGRNIYQKGTLIIGGQTLTDFCYDYISNRECKGTGNCVLVEHSCYKNSTSSSQTYLKEKVKCQNGCYDGACSQMNTTRMANETVRCVFSNSNTAQNCYSTNQKYSCSNKKICTNSTTNGTCEWLNYCEIRVNENTGTILEWKSSCGGYAKTIVDGMNEKAEFNCGTTAVKETVKCSFYDLTSPQQCDSNKGSCKATQINVDPSGRRYGACYVNVSGIKGEQVTWKSTCSEYAYTIMDGQNDVAEFRCGQINETPIIGEVVRCVFSNANSDANCYDANQKYGCRNKLICGNTTNSSCQWQNYCDVKVSEKKGTVLEWKSSCGGYATTTVDGINEKAEFKCSDAVVKESVKCSFYDLNSVQECYSNKGSCKATEINRDQDGNTYAACYIDIVGTMGEQVSWKSTCGGDAYTIMDGQNDVAEFRCGQINETPIIDEVVRCVFSNANSDASCYDFNQKYGCRNKLVCGNNTNSSCQWLNYCDMKVSEKKGTVLEWKSSCGGYAATNVDGIDEKAEFRCGNTVCGNGVVELNEECDDGNSDNNDSCTNECRYNAYKEETVCIFKNSANGIQKCYTNDNKYSCYGYGNCSLEVKEPFGTSLYWTSSCGGKATTFVDGQRSVIVFDCSPRTVSEIITCMFTGSTSKQTCYSDKGNICTGTAGCRTNVTGLHGSRLTWKSTCGGYVLTTTDGNSETISFNCSRSPVVKQENIIGQATTTTGSKRLCSEGEFAVSDYRDGHYYTAEKCISGSWVKI